ncbi:hypothetical protein ABG067_005839 [Albugo candida]|uniref:Uncharacterized protein n=1 Tax=Albugo candida TaxID=65357 RepID=A0A024G883_9STRA|nr:unnamed protein product [Albugo candida]|eukprot:CCI42869.1 unnamed protein product [Albugo candida]
MNPIHQDRMSIPTVQQLLRDVDKLHSMLRSLDDSDKGNKALMKLEHAQNRRKNGKSQWWCIIYITFTPYNADYSERPHVPRPKSKVAALTKENVSRLRPPHDHNVRKYSQAGSVSDSIQSHLSIRTDGGTVFSRLYQPDFHQRREEKLQSLRSRNERFHSANAVMKPARRKSVLSSVSSTSFHSGASGISSKTDCTGLISSRLYDPEYMKKRSIRLQRMKEEQELRGCTFAPSVRSTSSNRLQI